MALKLSKVNPTTGKQHWIVEDENYDYCQEIARSAYADMLHDTERNKKYELGIIAAIKRMRERGRACDVLDIGTGTGLLSMMAVRNGADTVHACDAFEPAAACAEKIIAVNGMAGKIKLIHKRSTDVLIPEDMSVKANILVTEVFDTELIGEGAISTFRHALKHLLEPDCIVVPSASRMYIQPVQSFYLSTCNHLKISLPKELAAIGTPPSAEQFNNGLAAPLFDLQLSQLSNDLFDALAPPKVVFTFDFCGRKDLPKENESVTLFTASTSGSCHAFFMWWDLDMDMDGDIQLSCAPAWHQPYSADELQWRDHWMQAVFFPQNPLPVVKGEGYAILSQHDEYSLAFDIQPADKRKEIYWLEDSGSQALHHCYTRPRLAMLQDTSSISVYMKSLQGKVDGNTTALCASESSSFLPYLLARLGAKKIYVVESGFIGSRRIAQSIIDYNELADVIHIYSSYDDIPASIMEQITMLVGEPYFSLTSLPWDDLRFWYIRSTLTHNVQVYPGTAHLMAMAVQFDDLHKIRQPVGVVEGLDLNVYDEMIENARLTSDDSIEPQSLWEYPCKALSLPFRLLTFDLATSLADVEGVQMSSEGHFDILSNGEYNGIAIWMVYDLDKSNQVSFGVLEDVSPGTYPKWNMERKQAVFLPRLSQAVTANKSTVSYKAAFHLEDGNMELSFSLNS